MQILKPTKRKILIRKFRWGGYKVLDEKFGKGNV